MKPKVTRLPVSHPMYPICPTCTRNMPTFDGATLLANDDMLGIKLLNVTYRIRCSCGSVWDLRKDTE